MAEFIVNCTGFSRRVDHNLQTLVFRVDHNLSVIFIQYFLAAFMLIFQSLMLSLLTWSPET